jgi:hypothetical protein
VFVTPVVVGLVTPDVGRSPVPEVTVELGRCVSVTPEPEIPVPLPEELEPVP